MMKRMMIVLMLALISTLIFADPVFTQGFEDAWEGTPLAPAGWTNYSTTASVSWARSTTYFTSGAASARVGYSTGNHWLVSPAISVPAGNHRLKFMARDHSASTSYDYPDEYLKIFVSNTFTGAVDVFTTEILSLGYLDTNVTFATYTADLSAYAGQTVYIAMQRISTGGNYVYIDDFTVEPILPVAPNAATLAFPANTMTTMANPLLRWSNPTTGEPATGVKVYVSNSATFGEPVATLAASANSYQTTGLAYATTYYWKVVPFNTNGDATGNQEYTFVTPGELQLAESFEGATFPPVGWDRDASTWVSNTNAIEGLKSTSVTSSTVTTPETSRKLITPKVTIAANSTLQFIAATTATTAQYLTVLTSPDKVTWTVLLANPITLTTAWTIYTVDLSSLSGQNLYVAIGAYRATASGTILLDHVVGPNITVETPGVAITPVPAHEADNISTTPTLSWTAPTTGGIPSGYKVYFGVTDNPTTLLATVNTTSYAITTPLIYATQYFWKVVPFNTSGEATGAPVWSFSTMPDPTVFPPYSQDFATYQPMSWEEKVGLLTDPVTLTGTTSAWAGHTVFANIADHAYGAEARINIWSTSVKDWLITPPIDLGTGGYQLEFDLALTAYNNTNVATPSPDDRFAVVVSTDNGLTWATANILHMWDNNTETAGSVYDNIATAGQHIVLPLNYTGVVRIGFYGESTVSNGDNHLHLDNVQVLPVPTLPIFTVSPTEKDFGMVTINTTSAAQTFTISNTGTGNLGITSLALTGVNADQFILTDTNTYPLTIAAGTNITVTVAFAPTTVGAKNAMLVITDNLSRTTHDVALSGEGFDPTINIPYTQNFDAQTTSALPTGWASYASTTGTAARPWVVSNNTNIGAISAPNYVGVHYSSVNPKNEWMVTPPVVMTAGTTYRIKFMLRAPGWQGTPEKLKVTVANAQTFEAISAGTVLWDDPNMLIPAYTEKIIPFTPTTTGSYYFGWHAYSIADVDFIAVDDITFEVGAVENPPTALTASAGNAIVDLSWTAPAAGSTGTLAGYKVYRNGTAITTAPVTGTTYADNTVTNGTTYTYFVTALYTAPAGESEPSNTVSATPVAPVLYPPTNLTASVTGDDVTLNWSAAGPAGTWITHGGEYATGIGTNAAANFHVAHRYSAAQLATLGVAGGQLLRVKIVGHEPGATYTVKVWTGGSANPYAAGTEVVSQAVAAITVDDWTEIVLTTPVTIPTDAELWIGYNVNTPGGFPAGADGGPQLEGFGNMMYYNNAWTTLSALSATLTRNWCIEGYATTTTGQLAKMEMPAAPVREKAVASFTLPSDKEIFRSVAATSISQNRSVNRDLLGYKVYRGTTLLTPTPLPTTTMTYQDMNLANGEYTYNVTAMYTDGESAPATVTATVNTDFVINQFPWNEGFEGTFLPTGWTNVDNDGDTNKWFEYTAAGAPHAGAKCVASASWTSTGGALTPDNWLITPKIALPAYGANQAARLKFWIAAQDPEWPQEHYSVMISTTNTNIASFTSVFSETLQSGDWIQKTIPLTNYSNQNIYIAFRHHAVTDMFYIKMDDVLVELVQDADINPVYATKLSRNYPNPFNPSTRIDYSVKETAPVTLEIFNVKGQKVRTLVNEMMTAGNHSVVWNGKDEAGKDAGSGVYFYKMSTPNYSATQKMILMK